MKILKGSAIAVVLLAALASIAPAWAQTASTALVLGTVTDAAGAVVPGATVDLTNTATNETKRITTNAEGQYAFPNVPPGTYTLKISKAGFATTTFSNIKLDVSKSYTYDARLEVSSGKEIVEVTAGATAELQTTDAVVGGVVAGQTLSHLPTLQRDTRELLTLQPREDGMAMHHRRRNHRVSRLGVPLTDQRIQTLKERLPCVGHHFLLSISQITSLLGAAIKSLSFPLALKLPMSSASA